MESYAKVFENFRSEFATYEMGVSMNELMDDNTEDMLKKFNSTIDNVRQMQNAEGYKGLFLAYQAQSNV